MGKNKAFLPKSKDMKTLAVRLNRKEKKVVVVGKKTVPRSSRTSFGLPARNQKRRGANGPGSRETSGRDAEANTPKTQTLRAGEETQKAWNGSVVRERREIKDTSSSLVFSERENVKGMLRGEGGGRIKTCVERLRRNQDILGVGEVTS